MCIRCALAAATLLAELPGNDFLDDNQKEMQMLAYEPVLAVAVTSIKLPLADDLSKKLSWIRNKVGAHPDGNVIQWTLDEEFKPVGCVIRLVNENGDHMKLQNDEIKAIITQLPDSS
jgi:hypothetical protein